MICSFSNQVNPIIEMAEIKILKFIKGYEIIVN